MLAYYKTGAIDFENFGDNMDKSNGTPEGDAIAWAETGRRQSEDKIREEINEAEYVRNIQLGGVVKRLNDLQECIEILESRLAADDERRERYG